MFLPPCEGVDDLTALGCMCVSMYACMYVCTYVCICIYIGRADIAERPAKGCDTLAVGPLRGGQQNGFGESGPRCC